MSESALGKADDSNNSCDKEVAECPTCGDIFKNEAGMKTHHYHAHNESISGYTYPCDECGEDVEYKQRRDDCEHFCDKSCESSYRKKNGRLLGITGIDHPSAKGEMMDCKQCGETFYCKNSHLQRRSFCSVGCVSEFLKQRTGSDHPRWKENTPKRYFYTTKRWKTVRQEVLKRDNNECQVCGDTRDLHVHHIMPVSEGGERYDKNNLVTLCNSDHRKWEGLYLRPDTRH